MDDEVDEHEQDGEHSPLGVLGHHLVEHLLRNFLRHNLREHFRCCVDWILLTKVADDLILEISDEFLIHRSPPRGTAPMGCNQSVDSYQRLVT